MERCRCDEIARCSRDIFKIQQAISKSQYLYTMGSEIHKRVKDVADDTGNSLSMKNLTPTCWLVKRIDGKLEEKTNDLWCMAKSYLYSLRNAHTSMQNEDALYHARISLELEQEKAEREKLLQEQARYLCTE